MRGDGMNMVISA